MAQSFYKITPVDVTPAVLDSWQDVNGGAYGIPLGATGAIVHIAPVNGGGCGLRKKGSTDNRTTLEGWMPYGHQWALVGLDTNRVFQAYKVSGATRFFLAGYTTVGVTMLTNGIAKTPVVRDAWTVVDCSAQAPNATGLAFEIINKESGSFGYEIGFRKNGSSDDRTGFFRCRAHRWVTIGCDSNQLVEMYLDSGGDWEVYLTGYVTDGVTFLTNGVDITPTRDDNWHDIDLSALAPSAGMVIVEENAPYVGYGHWGIREKNGSGAGISEWRNDGHAWGIVACDENQVIEGSVQQFTTVSLYIVGYTEAAPIVTRKGNILIDQLVYQHAERMRR